jgi:hypothetical protein
VTCSLFELHHKPLSLRSTLNSTLGNVPKFLQSAAQATFQVSIPLSMRQYYLLANLILSSGLKTPWFVKVYGWRRLTPHALFFSVFLPGFSGGTIGMLAGRLSTRIRFQGVAGFDGEIHFAKLGDSKCGASPVGRPSVLVVVCQMRLAGDVKDVTNRAALMPLSSPLRCSYSGYVWSLARR